MSTEIRVPTLGESVTEATVARWFKQAGQPVAADEPLVELETDKVTLEVNAPASGTLDEIAVPEGGEVEVGALLGRIAEGAGAGAGQQQRAHQPPPQQPEPTTPPPAPPETPPVEEPPTTEPPTPIEEPPGRRPTPEIPPQEPPRARAGDGQTGPAARKLIDEHGLDPNRIEPTGPKGNLTKGDVVAAIDARTRETRREAPQPQPAPAPREAPTPAPGARAGREERVRMTRLRRRIAERLKEAQNTAAMLTTFNEVDMGAVMELRERYRDTFEKRHGVRLGFMSFFVKASIAALKAFPAVNAEIDGDEIVYKHYYDIGVAVSTPSGLVVPVVRDADRIGFAEIEKKIGDLGRRARDGKLGMEELTGGTFSITNGGIFGSLLSTPILNPPQSAILGMHKIQKRPVVTDGDGIVVRPMMYLAVSYDHRIVDGREAVSFLVRIKECIEDPERLLLDL